MGPVARATGEPVPVGGHHSGLAGAARSIQAGGADFLVICTSTMHIVASEIEAAIDIPVLHIAG